MLEPRAESRASPRPCKKGWLLLTASSAVQKGPKKGGKKQERAYAWMSRAICHHRSTILDS